ncbi:hypothetical protein SCLCIDRAFT_1215594 [Scleroderma citrinum Foug A]|uniref:Uncharacterized protein n=1 Tax=Scleroderma citrinum Foug A TaxID=1036808 RepID=A0A0C2ZK27_9AGAM|nr:hypothetical protein SCLCIDRAFT_1215594 [Scleroderma citrinum Foug A]
MSPSPSAILTDALAAFNKAATLAITTAQDQARKDITQTTADTREARRERDEAIKALHACRLEEQAWKQEASVWKAAADQAELTIKHHLETIAQLRREATQWKEQCLRLEETSRLEAISWKEQFLRVDQERTKLAQRVDELVSEQLSTSTRLNALQTPSSRGTTGAGSVPGSRQVLLRRVQAVVEVPVKEESVDRGAPESGMVPSASTFPPSISSSKPTSAPTQSAKPNQATTRIKRKAVAKRRYVEVDDSDTTGEGFGSEPSEHDYPYVTSDDDDELMMGAEDNPNAVYGIKHIRKPPSTKKPSRPTGTRTRKVVSSPTERKNRPPGATRSAKS